MDVLDLEKVIDVDWQAAVSDQRTAVMERTAARGDKVDDTWWLEVRVNDVGPDGLHRLRLFMSPDA